MPGGETARQVLDRFLPALTKIAKENDGKTVAVFSHGAALRMVLGTLEGYPLSELGSTPHGDKMCIRDSPYSPAPRQRSAPGPPSAGR